MRNDSHNSHLLHVTIIVRFSRKVGNVDQLLMRFSISSRVATRQLIEFGNRAQVFPKLNHLLMFNCGCRHLDQDQNV